MASQQHDDREPLHPKWGELVERIRHERELLEEVAAQNGWTEEQRNKGARHLAEGHVEDLASALRVAELELGAAKKTLHELTAPKGKGNRRRVAPSLVERLVERVNFLRHCAAIDEEEREIDEKEDQKKGEKKPLVRPFVKAAMVDLRLLDPNDTEEPGVDAMFRAYQRSRRGATTK
jgi:hypothetical protein